jgi:hypothetical protein
MRLCEEAVEWTKAYFSNPKTIERFQEIFININVITKPTKELHTYIEKICQDMNMKFFARDQKQICHREGKDIRILTSKKPTTM